MAPGPVAVNALVASIKMCGRTRVSFPENDIVAVSGVPRERWRNPEQYNPSYKRALCLGVAFG